MANAYNSGGGAGIIPPPGVKGWSWGAFFLSWIWAVFNKTCNQSDHFRLIR